MESLNLFLLPLLLVPTTTAFIVVSPLLRVFFRIRLELLLQLLHARRLDLAPAQQTAQMGGLKFRQFS